MIQAADKKDVLKQLRKEILSLQGFAKPGQGQKLSSGLGQIEQSFPNNTFPLGAVHEFLSQKPEDAAATSGFMAGLLGRLMLQNGNGTCLWISTRRKIYPPALRFFGISPERVIFIDLHSENDALWAVEEALRCEALAAVVGEVSRLSFTDSRRLQLAVEQSRVTCFVHRQQLRVENTLACVSRWKIRAMPSQPEEGLPGPGFPCWEVQLLKVRNGVPGNWQLEWAHGSFRQLALHEEQVLAGNFRKAV